MNISCETSVFKKLGLRRALNTRRYSWWENTRRRQSYPGLFIDIIHSWELGLTRKIGTIFDALRFIMGFYANLIWIFF